VNDDGLLADPGRRRAVLSASRPQAEAVAAALAAVATAARRDPLSELGAGTVAGACRHVLGQPEVTIEPGALPDPAAPPAELAGCFPGPWEAEVVTRLLTVAALADATLDGAKVDLLLEYAEALGVEGDYLRQVELGARGDEADMTRDMMRQNLRSIPGIGWDETWSPRQVEDALAPYGGDHADLELAASYRKLAGCAPGSLGRTFFDFYQRYGFAFPGEPLALNEHFATRHDSTHLLSGYNTSLQGELLVSTFTATMHEVNPMSGHIVPVIVSWHVGTQVNEVAKKSTGWYDPAKFFVAWARGAATTGDTFHPGWALTDHADTNLDELRTSYGISPFDPTFGSSGPVPMRGDVHRPAES